MLDLEDANEDRFAAFAVQPAVILPRDSGCISRATGKLYGAIPADILAGGMVQIALNGFPEKLVEIDKLP